MSEPFAPVTAGRMTELMRAVKTDEPRALRVGLVRGGRVMQERLFKSPTRVTAGRAEGCILLLADSRVPDEFVLFEPVAAGQGYVVHLPPGMTGRVAVDGELIELGAGFDGGASAGKPATSWGLSPSSRGKLVVGEEVILFGFVDLPPTQARPQLPLSVRSGTMESIDWAFTMLASLSFLLHFGAVGMLYSDWMDPTVGDEVIVAGLVESVRSMQQLAPTERPDVVDNANEPVSTAPLSERDGRPGGRDKNPRGRDTGAEPGAPSASLNESEVKGLSDELDRIDIATLAVLNGGPGKTAEVMSDRGLPTNALEELAQRPGAVREGNDYGLHMGESSTTISRPGEEGRNRLADVANTRADRPTDSGKRAATDGPKPAAVAVASRPQVAGSEVPNAESVVAGMQASFRRCYELGLGDLPEMSGSVRVAAQIGPNGEVLSVSANPSGTVTAAVAGCIANRVRGAQFDRPKDGVATLIIPVSLLQQPRR